MCNIQLVINSSTIMEIKIIRFLDISLIHFGIYVWMYIPQLFVCGFSLPSSKSSLLPKWRKTTTTKTNRLILKLYWPVKIIKSKLNLKRLLITRDFYSVLLLLICSTPQTREWSASNSPNSKYQLYNSELFTRTNLQCRLSLQKPNNLADTSCLSYYSASEHGSKWQDPFHTGLKESDNTLTLFSLILS